jgi:S1-C subfamily serine protease
MFIDILIVLFTLSAMFRGNEIGFVRQLCSTIGFFGGLFIGAALEPHTVNLVHTAASRSAVTVATTLGCALILLTLGEYLGIMLKHKVLLKRINSLDNILGSGLSIISLLLSVWLSAAILNALPVPRLQADIHGSWIVTKLDMVLPPAPTVITDLGQLIDPNGFPQVFVGSEPSPPALPLPNLGDLQAAVNKDKGSVVKIEGQGCGGIVEGSGFVVGSDLVATNAHVVAGISQPYVQDANGNHSATVIWFDPNLDFAVLRVSNLAGHALNIDGSRVSNGTPGAVLGYPGGGPFDDGAAAVAQEFTAIGRNIYGSGTTTRQVYELQATIIPGNSGGPLVNEAGSVIGVVFAQSTTYNHVGYALTTDQIITEINQAEAQNQATGTGSCAE